MTYRFDNGKLYLSTCVGEETKGADPGADVDHVNAEDDVGPEIVYVQDLADVDDDGIKDVLTLPGVGPQTGQVLWVEVTGLPGDRWQMLGEVANMGPGPGGNLETLERPAELQGRPQNIEDRISVPLSRRIYFLAVWHYCGEQKAWDLSLWFHNL